MNSSENNLENLVSAKLTWAARIHHWEGDISEAIYRIWCRLTGYKFERKRKERQNSCVLVTKTGFHLISSLIFRNIQITPRQLEVYQMNCPEKVPYGFGQTAYKYSKYILSEPFKCSDCGRCFEVQEGDKKIVGKF